MKVIEVTESGEVIERTLSSDEETAFETERAALRQETEDAINALPYDKKRASAYPSIQEQLDMQYWDSVNGTTTWADAIAKVKADYPKGGE